MTKLSEFDAALTKFKTQVHAKVKANQGGPTWVAIQTLAANVVACEPQVDQLAATKNVADPKERAKQIEAKLKVLRTKYNAIKLVAISKYIKEHGAGGAKTRGLLSTAKAKAEEKVRVTLATEFLKQFGLMQIMLNELGPSDMF